LSFPNGVAVVAAYIHQLLGKIVRDVNLRVFLHLIKIVGGDELGKGEAGGRVFELPPCCVVGVVFEKMLGKGELLESLHSLT